MQQLCQTGLPKKVYMDSLAAHKSALVTAVTKIVGVEVSFTTSYHKAGLGTGWVDRWPCGNVRLVRELGAGRSGLTSYAWSI